MKKGITSTIAFELEIEVTDVAEVIFTFKEKIDSENYLLQKSYPEDVTFEDNKFLCKLTQEETDSLTNTFFVEAQVNLTNKSVIKSDIGKEIMPPTLWTTFVEDNESSGDEEIITLTFTDHVEGGGSGGTTNYNELSNKPRFNDIEWVGNKTDSDMGIATKGELQTKADKSDTYTKEETNTLLGSKQDTLADGNGVKIENDEISVDITSNSALEFITGRLNINSNTLGRNLSLRQSLTSTFVDYPLASKSYVDNLMSGAVKRLVVESLPTQDIDTNTIYMILKSAPTTNNIYDEYMYINNAWELIGSTEVDLSNYYTKSETNTLLNAKVSKAEITRTIELERTIKSDRIQTSVWSSLSGIKCDDFPSGASLMIYPQDMNGNELDPIDITSLVNTSQVKYINQYSGFKFFYDGSESSIEIEYRLYDNVVRERKLYWDLTNGLATKQDIIDTDHKLNADLLVDGTTNKTVTSDEKSNWSGKSKSYSAVFVNNEVSFAKSDYPNIQDGDFIYVTDGSRAKIWLVVSTSAPTNLIVSEVKEISFVSGTPPTFVSYSSDTKYSVNEIVFSDNGNIYRCLTQTSSSGGLNYTWQEYKGTDTTYTAGTGLTLSSGAFSVDNPLPSSAQADSGKILSVNSSGNAEWQTKNYEDKTDITTDTTSTTVSLTLADNHEYRYTQDLTSLTLTMPSGDFISSIVFASGSTPTSMTYDSSIKWSGDDVTNGQFVPSADKDYDIMMYYNGLNVNGIVRGV